MDLNAPPRSSRRARRQRPASEGRLAAAGARRRRAHRRSARSRSTDDDLEAVARRRDASARRASASTSSRPATSTLSYSAAGHRPLPRERLPPAGSISFAFRYVPARGADVRDPRAPDGRRAARRRAPRPRPRHRRDRLGQVHDARGDGRPHQPRRGSSTSSRSRIRSRSSTPTSGCIVNQREIGLDTESFNAGPPPRAPPGPGRDPDRRAARRGVGAVALQAAESGHLVLSTMHTLDAAETIGRMIEFFPAGEADDGPADPRGRPARRRQPAPAPARSTAAASPRSRSWSTPPASPS